MLKKTLIKKSELEVSIIGFGGIPIQKVDEDTAISLIKKASSMGINFIDTARVYGKSEELIGQAIQEDGIEKWIIATKSPMRDYEGMKEEIDKSLKALRVDSIDLYQLHNVRTEKDYKKVMSEDGALKALKEAKEKGLIKHIGITSHDVDTLKIAIETNEFETIQFPYNPVELQGEELFKRANELGIGVIIMKPVAGGAIQNVSLSLRYIANNSNITTIIPGVNKIEEIEENCEIGNNFRQLTNEEKEIILKEAKELGSEFCRRCGYCAPCPQGIDIPSQFILEGYYSRYNLPEWAKERYGALKTKASDCIKCGACEPRCPYDLPIRDMLERVVKNLG